MLYPSKNIVIQQLKKIVVVGDKMWEVNGFPGLNGKYCK